MSNISIKQKLQQVTEARQRLLSEHANLEAKLKEKLAAEMFALDVHLTQTNLSDHPSNPPKQDLSVLPADESVENLRAKLRELEKRCALQQLRHEEVLLELEDVRKRARTSTDSGPFHGLPGSVISLDSVYRSSTDLNLLGHSAEPGITEGRVYNVTNRTSSTSNLQTQIKGRLFGNNMGGPIKTGNGLPT
ncbi:hypothetical protein AHF37_12089 [Paragonimus kellicotti]|nr:hypothetical protein AHF37_12089 [Paragonimus kellicotti]